jgi:cytochrome P450
MTQVCSEPEEFIPERFMDDASPESRLPYDPRDIAFGFGRRACAGRHFAEANVWLAIARIVAAFDISKVLDAEGVEVTPPMAFTESFVR